MINNRYKGSKNYTKSFMTLKNSYLAPTLSFIGIPWTLNDDSFSGVIGTNGSYSLTNLTYSYDMIVRLSFYISTNANNSLNVKLMSATDDYNDYASYTTTISSTTFSLTTGNHIYTIDTEISFLWNYHYMVFVQLVNNWGVTSINQNPETNWLMVAKSKTPV